MIEDARGAENVEVSAHFHRRIRVHLLSLAAVAQWIERWPVNHRVASSIPSQGHMPGLQAGSPVRDR